MKLQVGPLHYELLAHDAWGEDMLLHLQAHTESCDFRCAPRRFIHLLEYKVVPKDVDHVSPSVLPECLADILPGDCPTAGWTVVPDQTGFVFRHHPQSPHCVWTHDAAMAPSPTPYQLPWQPIVEDIVRESGGLVHSGLAAFDNRSYLFAAPPGGGKTTALSRISHRWEVLADDAALVWPREGPGFLSSPLPTWSVLLSRKTTLPRIPRWKIAAHLPLAGVFVLRKAKRDRTSRLLPQEAARHLYLALSEHPRVLPGRDPFRKDLFHTACALARSVPAWRLGLSREGTFWTLIEETLSHA